MLGLYSKSYADSLKASECRQIPQHYRDTLESCRDPNVDDRNDIFLINHTLDRRQPRNLIPRRNFLSRIYSNAIDA